MFHEVNRQFEAENGKKFNKVLGYGLLLLIVTSAIILYSFRYEIRLFFLLHNKKFDTEIAVAAKKNNIDPLLIKAVIIKESKFNKNCIGGVGEIGLMQVRPEFAAKDWSDRKKLPPLSKGQLAIPEINIEVGSWYLATRLKKWQKYDKSLELALCEYNAGIKRANQWKPATFDGEVIQNINIKSTKKYVQDIMSYYQKLKEMED
ncbi:lytic transglycosylase domain-containing protein [Lentisphaerota bacterium WC36G]|nr:lytic transglycosylase domain-containing protein [Lentisphaerae bacterium WC36]